MQLAWIFLKIFKYHFIQGNLRKNMTKNIFKKKQQFSVKILAKFWLKWIFFSRFSLFYKGYFIDL